MVRSWSKSTYLLKKPLITFSKNILSLEWLLAALNNFHIGSESPIFSPSSLKKKIFFFLVVLKSDIKRSRLYFSNYLGFIWPKKAWYKPKIPDFEWDTSILPVLWKCAILCNFFFNWDFKVLPLSFDKCKGQMYNSIMTLPTSWVKNFAWPPRELPRSSILLAFQKHTPGKNQGSIKSCHFSFAFSFLMFEWLKSSINM